ncbi:MAG: hypothetical protein M1480_13755 [Bacteroidetes bacterium]|nr:hypothetical protein [Bacteroidota bacterium]
MEKAKKNKRFRVGEVIKVVVGDKKEGYEHHLRLHSEAKIEQVNPTWQSLGVRGISNHKETIHQSIHYSQAEHIRKKVKE